MMGTSRKVMKVPFKTNKAFNSTILPVLCEQKEQTNREKYAFFCSFSQIHINPRKKLEKNIEMTFCDAHTYRGHFFYFSSIGF